AEARRRRSNSSRLISAPGLGFALFMLNCVLAKAKRAAEAKRAVETNARAADNHSARDGRPQRPRSAHLLRRPDAQNGERRFERLPNAGRKRKSRLRYTSFFFVNEPQMRLVLPSRPIRVELCGQFMGKEGQSMRLARRRALGDDAREFRQLAHQRPLALVDEQGEIGQRQRRRRNIEAGEG